MPVKTVNAGRSVTQRGSEDPLIANQIYTQGVIQAYLANISNSNVVPSSIGVGNYGQAILLFTQDYPCSVWGHTEYGQSYVPPNAIGGDWTAAPLLFEQSDWPDYVIQEGDPAQSHANIFTSTVLATHSYKQRVFGELTTSGLDVGGYLLVYLVQNRNLGNNANPSVLINADQCTLHAQTENGVVSGNSLNFFGGAGNPPVPPPRDQIILLETDYTQAMYDAGNIVTSADGVVSKIVGVYFAANG